MLLSLITPTHNPRYLTEAYSSLKLQKYKNWEWVIVPNHGAKIPDKIKEDPKVRIVPGGDDLHNIGSLKKYACDAARGDVFIEFDHDDLLMPGDSLTAIAEQASNGAGFIFSDCAVFRFKEKTNKDPRQYSTKFHYATQHGWETYDRTVYGRPCRVTKAFPVTPRSLAQIHYCPDHVRAWSRRAYYLAGGHNTQLSVCDDHELMVKTYLTGSKFASTGDCHYLYRMFKANTVLMRNKLIQDTTYKLRERYLPKLIQQYLVNHELPELNLTKLINDGWSTDQLLQGFGESSYGHIVADCELQKLEGWQVREFMNEAYSALVPGGYLTVVVPDAVSGAGYIDPEWKSYFGRSSMVPYTYKHAAKQNKNVRCRYQLIDTSEVYPSDYHRDAGLKFYKFQLCALHGQRHPGVQNI